MANRRMLSKSVSTSTKLSEVSNFSKLLFTWIIPHCDDYGHLEATPKIVKGIVVPLCDETVEQVANSLLELEKAGLITFYEKEGRRYLEIVNWDNHQTFKTDRPKVALYPHKIRKPVVSSRKPKDSFVPLKLSEVKLSEVKLIKPSSKEDGGKPNVFGNEEINEVVSFLKHHLGGTPDGPIDQNRRFAKLLLEKMRKDYPARPATESVKKIIEAGMKDQFHSKNATNFKYLYYNCQKIIQTVREKVTNPKFIQL